MFNSSQQVFTYKLVIENVKLQVLYKNTVKIENKLQELQTISIVKLNHKNRAYLSMPYLNQSNIFTTSSIISSPLDTKCLGIYFFTSSNQFVNSSETEVLSSECEEEYPEE